MRSVILSHLITHIIPLFTFLYGEHRVSSHLAQFLFRIHIKYLLYFWAGVKKKTENINQALRGCSSSPSPSASPLSALCVDRRLKKCYINQWATLAAISVAFAEHLTRIRPRTKLGNAHINVITSVHINCAPRLDAQLNCINFNSNSNYATAHAAYAQYWQRKRLS